MHGRFQRGMNLNSSINMARPQPIRDRRLTRTPDRRPSHEGAQHRRNSRDRRLSHEGAQYRRNSRDRRQPREDPQYRRDNWWIRYQIIGRSLKSGFRHSIILFFYIISFIVKFHSATGDHLYHSFSSSVFSCKLITKAKSHMIVSNWIWSKHSTWIWVTESRTSDDVVKSTVNWIFLLICEIHHT